jgi:hypothetical protein
MTVRQVSLRIGDVLGAVVGYGCLAAFLSLISFQVYHWFRDGEWVHIGVTDGLRVALAHLNVVEGSRLGALSHWLDAPVDWLGLHKTFEVVPASLALFAASILGNSIHILSSDRIRAHGRSRPASEPA